MPKRKKGGVKSKQEERNVRAALRRKREAGEYLNPGDADVKAFTDLLSSQGLTLRDVPGDG